MLYMHRDEPKDKYGSELGGTLCLLLLRWWAYYYHVLDVDAVTVEY